MAQAIGTVNTDYAVTATGSQHRAETREVTYGAGAPTDD